MHCRDSCNSGQWTFNKSFPLGRVHHVITPHIKLEEPPTIVAPLPSLFPCRLEDLLGRGVLGAIAVVGIALANSASVCAAHWARSRSPVMLTGAINDEQAGR